MLFEEGQRLSSGFFKRDCRRFDFFSQATLGVHFDDDRVHTGEPLVGGVDDKIGPFSNHIEIVIGDDCCNFYDDIFNSVEAGHLEVHPSKHGLRLRVERGFCDIAMICTPANWGYSLGAMWVLSGGLAYDTTVLRVPVQQLDPDLPLPVYAKPGDAGLDLLARESHVLKAGGGRGLVPTGIAVALPEGYAGFIQPRSGLAFKHGVTCLNTPGLIDAGYRGELKVLLINTDPTEDFKIERGERIAQFVVQAVEHVDLEVVVELDATDRGEGGFGHTGR